MKDVSVGIIYPVADRLFVEALAASIGEGGVSVAWSGDEVEIGSRPDALDEILGCDVLMVLSSCSPETLSALAAAREARPGIRTVMLATERDEASLAAARAFGADGYLRCDIGLEALRECLRLLLSGVQVFPSAGGNGADRAANGFRDNGKAEPVEEESGSCGLSPREVEVVRAIRKGLPNKEIARRLNISESTVKTHVKAVLRKTGATNRTQVATWAMKYDSCARGAPSEPGRE